jgi:hypothetical protein
MYKLLLLNILLCVSFVEAKITKINNSSLLAPSDLGEVNLYHTPGKFFISQNGEFHAIESYNTDALLKTLKTEHLDKFQQVAFFSISQLSDGEFVLRGHIRGNGGGPMTASAFYWITKSVLYGSVAATATTAVVATGGAAGAAIGGAIGGAGAAAGGATAGSMILSGVVTVGTGGVSTATAVGGAMIGTGAAMSTGIATGATVVTGASIVASGGCLATFMGMVEAASATMAAIGAVLPTP